MDIGQIGSTAKAGVRVDHQPSPVIGSVSSTVKNTAAPVLTSSAVQQPDAALAQSQVGQALESINKALQALSSNLEFTIDSDNRTIVKVVDQQTNEIIRQMPSVEALEIYKALDKLQGLLLRQKA